MGVIHHSEPSSLSPPSSSHSSSARHYYIAVDRLQFKMEALVGLLGVLCQRRSLSIVLSCSSRDELDSVYSTISNLPRISLWCLYSDLAESERTKVLEKFRQLTAVCNQTFDHLSEGIEGGQEESKCNVLVLTDICLPLVNSGELPLTARVLINWELPAKKETYMRRISTCLAADGIVLNMVVGGEVVNLKSLEESTGLMIEEMPIDISEIL